MQVNNAYSCMSYCAFCRKLRKIQNTKEILVNISHFVNFTDLSH